MLDALKSKRDNWESIDPDRVRSKESEKVADVGNECERLGGVSIVDMTWWLCDCAGAGVVVFSVSFFRLMIILMLSFCVRR